MEALHSWLHGEKLHGRRVAETQATDNMLSEPPPEAAVTSPSPTKDGSPDSGLASDQGADMLSDAEDPYTPAVQSMQGLRPRHAPDRYAPVRGIRSVHGLSHNLSLSILMLWGLLMAASTLSRCEASSGYSGDGQHLGEYSNTSPSVSGDGALVDPVVGGSPLLTESLLD